MDVTNADQAKIAEAAGAAAVMALERVPSDIRKQGGIARMADPRKIKEIRDAVSLPIMAKCRIGHVTEAQVLQALDVDFIDESEVLSRADDKHITKHSFHVPFVCGCTNLPQALRRLTEGATMIRTKGEAGTGDVLQAVLHVRKLQDEIEQLRTLSDSELQQYALGSKADLGIVLKTAELGRLPAVTFAAGGIATPSDAALLMQLGVDGVFVGSVHCLYQSVLIYEGNIY